MDDALERCRLHPDGARVCPGQQLDARVGLSARRVCLLFQQIVDDLFNFVTCAICAIRLLIFSFYLIDR